MVKKGKIICQVNMFDLKQHVLFFDYESNSIDEIDLCRTSELIDTIVKHSLLRDVDEIELLGDYDYLSTTAKMIQMRRFENYNTKEVRIFINGKIFN